MANNDFSPKVSVIINTCDRGAYLGDTLEGLKQQTFKDFEVLVVNGPSHDNTEEVAKSYNVRYYTAPYNISVSRNVGIKNAAGDILAFIDDDAVPEPDWLNDLVEAYKDPEVGAAGGFVYNQDGSDFQFCYGKIDKWGYPQSRTTKPYDFNKPHGNFYNINIGTNASYRRDVLIEVGGFDEEIEYYHDESDVCVRVINAGYKVAQLDNAFVHHKMAPSSRRDNKKRVTNWDAIVKNTIYYGIKTSEGNEPLHKRLFVFLPKECRKFVGMFLLFTRGHYTPWQYIIRNFSLIRAFYRGYQRGFFQPRKLISDYTHRPEEFNRYVPNREKSLNIVLVSQGYPPNNTDGISRYNYTLAKQLANMGHRVFVVTKSLKKGKETIIYSEKHWKYFHDPNKYGKSATGYGRTDNLLALNKSIYKTVQGITKKTKIDAIVAPLWDVEGAALIRNKLAPTAITLMSPLKKVVETQWYYLDDPSLETVYEIEKFCIENADGVMAISGGIKNTIGDAYDINWDKIQSKHKPVNVIPLGVDPEVASNKTHDKINTNEISILFVGRFERRKGVDVLFEAAAKLLPKYSNVVLDLVGNPDIVDENNKKYYKEFESQYSKENWFKRVRLHGYVNDEQLAVLYENCSIFVAPSRYESFGIIFIEAMAHAKPVVGTNVGGIPEIISDGKNGYLFKNEDHSDLHDKLEKLVKDQSLRRSMGTEGLKILTTKFSSERMGKNFETFIEQVIKSTVQK